MASSAMTAATAAAAAALTPSTTFIRAKASDNNGPRIIPPTNHEDYAAPRCVVSRNGITVPWRTIHQKYGGSVSNCNGVDDDGINKGIKDDTDGDCGDGNFDDDALAMDAVNLLQLLPRGAYTTCRTVRGGTRVYQFDYHVRRLALSAQSILEKISGGGNGNGNDWGGRDCNGNVNISASAKECGGGESTTESNHLQQQHDRNNPSKDEIHKLNIIDEARERDMTLYCIRSTLDAFRNTYHQTNDNNNNSNPGHSNNDGNDDEFRIVLLATWEKKETQCQQQQQQPECLLPNNHNTFQSVLYCHVRILPQSSFKNNNNNESAAPHNRVLVHGHGRDNALAKDSKWVIERKKLMTPQTPPSTTSNSSSSSSLLYEEIILINDEGELLEGTQTNFYVVINSSPGSSAIITADEGILHGSVRDSVLRVCHAYNVRVELRAPTLNDLRNAKGAFVTSTSRLVMPVHEVVLGDLQYFPHSGDGVDSRNDNGGDCNDGIMSPLSYCYPNCITTQNIRQWVLDDVETHSTFVYEPSD